MAKAAKPAIPETEEGIAPETEETTIEATEEKAVPAQATPFNALPSDY